MANARTVQAIDPADIDRQKAQEEVKLQKDAENKRLRREAAAKRKAEKEAAAAARQKAEEEQLKREEEERLEQQRLAEAAAAKQAAEEEEARKKAEAYHDIPRLYIAVNNSSGVSISHSFTDFAEDG